LIENLKIKIFADGADQDNMIEMYNKPFIKGLTTNPTLMKQAGIKDYEYFGKEVLQTITDKPISFEVFSDEFNEMERQALKISNWGKNVFVKIPVTNTRGENSLELIEKLSKNRVKLNITAMTTFEQVEKVVQRLDPQTYNYVSLFAGRVADTGIDPLNIMKKCVNLLKNSPKTELIWASPRELLNIFQANEIGCHVITVTPDILKKLKLIGKNLDEYSLETVKMFYHDAMEAGYNL
jgi:transaldolase